MASQLTPATYYTDEARLVWVESMSGDQVLVEDCVTGEVELFERAELSRTVWRQVKPKRAARVKATASG